MPSDESVGRSYITTGTMPLEAGSVGYGGSFFLGSGQIEFRATLEPGRPRQGGIRDLQP